MADGPVSHPEPLEKRKLLSELFLVMLLSMAYEEAVVPTGHAIHEKGLSLQTAALFFVFFLTTLRYFMGNQLHLTSRELLAMPGRVWFFDFFWIMAMYTVMIFLGAVATVDASQESRYGFVPFLFAVFLLDIAWICSQWVLGKVSRSWKRKSIPWSWAILNLALIALLLVAREITGDWYSTAGLWAVMALNLAATVIDVFLIDHHGFFE